MVHNTVCRQKSDSNSRHTLFAYQHSNSIDNFRFRTSKICINQQKSKFLVLILTSFKHKFNQPKEIIEHLLLKNF